jgi:hypothetical protein
LKKEARRKAFQERLAKMKEENPANELAGKLLGELDQKQGQDLDDLLKGQFAVRAKDLKANMLALAEQEAEAKAVINKNSKAKKRAMQEIHEKLADKVDAGQLAEQFKKD